MKHLLILTDWLKAQFSFETLLISALMLTLLMFADVALQFASKVLSRQLYKISNEFNSCGSYKKSFMLAYLVRSFSHEQSRNFLIISAWHCPDEVNLIKKYKSFMPLSFIKDYSKERHAKIKCLFGDVVARQASLKSLEESTLQNSEKLSDQEFSERFEEEQRKHKARRRLVTAIKSRHNGMPIVSSEVSQLDHANDGAFFAEGADDEIDETYHLWMQQCGS